MIHDADLDDAKFQRVECIGIDRVLKGWAKEGMSDEQLSCKAHVASMAFTGRCNVCE